MKEGGISASVETEGDQTLGLYDANQVGVLKSALQALVNQLHEHCQDTDEDVDPGLLRSYRIAMKLLQEMK